MIYALFFSILILLVICFLINKKDVIAPALIFTFGFFFQSIWAVLYSEKWELGLHFNTYIVITGGIAIFILVSKIVSLLYNRKNKINKEKSVQNIKIDKWKKICFLIFSIFVTVYYLYFIVNTVGGNIFDIKSIINSISQFDKLSKFSETVIKIPFLIGNLKNVVIAAGYWFMYVVIRNYISSKKIDFLGLSIIIVSLILSVLNGSRTLFFFMIVAGIEYLIMFTTFGKNKLFNKKIMLKITIIGIVFLALFASFARILGRDIKINTVDYLAIYCGAEVKNLDLFLQESPSKEVKYFGAQTFQPVITTIGQKIGFEGYKDYKLDLPFRHVGKYSLGNVYTTFYPYIYDFGYIGLVLIVILMAIISQLIYETAKKKRNNNFPSIWSVSYGLVFACLLLSFFSNKFYENIFTMDFIKKLVIWYIFTWFFCKLDFKKLIKNNKKQK